VEDDVRRNGIVCIALSVLLSSAAAAVAQVRPPATPLIAHNPYFSVWSATDKLTASETRHWTGARQPIAGLARIDGKPYRFMGTNPDNVPAMEQTAQWLTPTRTGYRFRAGGVELALEFFTPAFPEDLDLISRPVTYLTWKAAATDGAAHEVAVLVDVDPMIAVNEASEPVVTTRSRTERLEVLSVGSRDQKLLNRSGDDLRIDWGYFHLAVPKSEDAVTARAEDAVREFATQGKLPANDAIEMPRAPQHGASHLALELRFGSVRTEPVVRHAMVAYTEGYAIQYLERNLRPYWQRNGKTEAEMLDEAEAQYSALERRGAAFDKELTADLTKAGGAHYADLAVLSYRQTLAAHVLVADVNGRPMYFLKENFSNGCIATVDVLYPSAPFFLLLQPRLLEAQMQPVMEYAALPRWKFPFAPHDLGQYPLANGQVYGGGERTEDDQMPVEETGNMLILLDALAQIGHAQLAEQYWPQLTAWAAYLKEKGFDPENQLTTDDFAGHVAHNTNLSLKAIEALAAYADLARRLHHDAEAAAYLAAAKGMATRWTAEAREGDHYKLAFNSPGTWSQKYNLVWDTLLGFQLFPQSVRDTEITYYRTKMNEYGLPLDNRADYTKLDWSAWTATMATDPRDSNAIMDAIARWISATPDRVPLSDWYETKTARHVGFQARSVVGGVYIKALADKQLAEKWQARAEAKAH
jgi:hypothetical protein